MPVVTHLIRVQQKVLPALLTALLQTIKAILHSSHLTVPVWLSCKNLFYFAMYLVYSWGKLFLKMYSTQVREVTGNLINSLIKYSFPIDTQRTQVGQVLDEVSDELCSAFQVPEAENSSTITGVVEEILPLRSLLRDVKMETSRDVKLDIWIDIIVNSWSQAVLFPYIIGSLLLLRPVEKWCDLEISLSNGHGDSDSLPKRNADAILLQRVKNEIEDFIKPLQSAVRRCLIRHLIQVKSGSPQRELNFDAEDQLDTLTTNRESLLKAMIRRDELGDIMHDIRSSLESHIPSFEEACVHGNADGSHESLALRLSQTESCVALRKHIIDTIFHTECLPFLDGCLVESESEGKLLHQCVKIAARLQRVVQNWITPYEAVGEFLSNIKAL